ncbi:MAG: hypothetical protein KJ904_07385 [Alphaproteobacteria bacterium]|nr:hypothetical protein [Alphaproteobacteria bacterium]MBU0795934.1 hypothetical protein [Alphaproteobacteria bacterium]MBU0886971.1 hypothetical protein [Alphaproteobacteria bacterium]MBU1813173.1 hypothetical protein [Alphaproteobacteria bacterium]
MDIESPEPESRRPRISTEALVQIAVLLGFAVIGVFALPYAAESALMQQVWIAICGMAGL